MAENLKVNETSKVDQNLIMDEIVKEYVQSLTSDQHKIIEIAKKQLGTSYDLKKSIGFVQFIKKRGL